MSTDISATKTIVDALTRAIVEHRLEPGAKLAEQKLADHYGVSRTIVRQALFQLSQKKIIFMQPARGAFVASPSVQEAEQVFAVRRMLEAEMTRSFIKICNASHIRALQEHVAIEAKAIERQDVPGRTELLGDFHVLIAHLMDNEVLAQILNDLISRCALITLMYQTDHQARDSAWEHVAIVDAFAKKNEKLALQLMEQHLLNVEKNLVYSKTQSAPMSKKTFL